MSFIRTRLGSRLRWIGLAVMGSPAQGWNAWCCDAVSGNQHHHQPRRGRTALRNWCSSSPDLEGSSVASGGKLGDLIGRSSWRLCPWTPKQFLEGSTGQPLLEQALARRQISLISEGVEADTRVGC